MDLQTLSQTYGIGKNLRSGFLLNPSPDSNPVTIDSSLPHIPGRMMSFVSVIYSDAQVTSGLPGGYSEEAIKRDGLDL
jgi:hypothetical protein